MMTARAKKEAVRLVERGDYNQASLVLQQIRQQLLDNSDLSMSAPEAEAIADLETQLQEREYVKYRKVSTHQSYSRAI